MKKRLVSAVVGSLMAGTAMASDLPDHVQAVLILKILAAEQKISDQPQVSIYVKDAPLIAAELKKLVGQKIGLGVLAKVEAGINVPSEKFSSIYVGSKKDIEKTIEYTSSQDVLSLTDDETLVSKGISVGMSAEGGRPKFILNLTASKNEGLEWKPSILNIASGGNDAP